MRQHAPILPVVSDGQDSPSFSQWHRDGSDDPEPTATLLDWLRETRATDQYQEGCNEGDCRACTVTVSGIEDGSLRHRAQNACILFLPQLHGKGGQDKSRHRREDGTPHPVQRDDRPAWQ